MLKTLLLVMFVGWSLSPRVLADQITFKNGDRLSGKIVKSDTATFNLGLNAARATSRDKIIVYAAALYAKNKVSGNAR